jgi:hypothetical protein
MSVRNAPDMSLPTKYQKAYLLYGINRLGHWWPKLQIDTMSFGLCHALDAFQRMMNDTMRDFLHKILIVYLDDVCV